MKKILLIIDDEKLVYETLSVQLEETGVEILSVANGADGLKMALKHHPDLILLDLIMPVMDGLTMLHKLREDKWGEQAQVIVLSNISDTDKVKEAIDNGSGEYLIKADWNVIEVANKIKNILNLV